VIGNNGIIMSSVHLQNISDKFASVLHGLQVRKSHIFIQHRIYLSLDSLTVFVIHA
jgi:hypothetical protein